MQAEESDLVARLSEGKAPVTGGRARMLAAARREPTDGPPLWIMRQAGRYLPEYHEVRSTQGFMATVSDPPKAAEITLQPLRRFPMDAAVIFSDILVPLSAMGLDVEVHKGEGPRVEPPVRTLADIERLSGFDPGVATAFLGESLGLVRRALGQDQALIGFCGAPFTLASYAIEGRSSRNYENTKAMLYGEPEHFRTFVDRLVDVLIPYCGYQVQAGADIIQIFDSWGGSLDARTYAEVFAEPLERLIVAVRSLGVPVILYANGGSHLLEVLAETGPDVLGLDWRVDPREARRRVGDRCALQGNLDPTALLAPPERLAALVDRCLDAFGPEPGHIFNLGSGMLPMLPVRGVEVVVERVLARRGGGAQSG